MDEHGEILRLRERITELEREKEAVEGFAAVAAHELLTPVVLLHHASFRDLPLQKQPVDLDALLRDCVALLGPELRRRNSQIEVETALPCLPVEEPLIGAVFINLLANALKYGPRHGSTIRVGAAAEPGVWRLSVRSEGNPIPAEDRDEIFRAYRRGSGERRARGSGLGLYICRQIVERHGGEITVVSAGGGNCFAFTLPVS